MSLQTVSLSPRRMGKVSRLRRYYHDVTLADVNRLRRLAGLDPAIKLVPGFPDRPGGTPIERTFRHNRRGAGVRLAVMWAGRWQAVILVAPTSVDAITAAGFDVIRRLDDKGFELELPGSFAGFLSRLADGEYPDLMVQKQHSLRLT